MPIFDQQSLSLCSLAFRNAGPICVIDLNGCLIDWNPTFDQLIAKPFHIRKGHHVSAAGIHLPCVTLLQTEEATSERQSQIQNLTIELPLFGSTQFQCIMSQMLDPNGLPFAWTASLIPADSLVHSKIGAEMIQRLESEITWAKYAAVYDSLLLNFPAYCQLLQQVSNAVNGYLQCADLGTGTGNSAIQLLEDEPERSVVAVDSNEFMLRRFLSKAGDRFSRRLQIRQDDVEYMPFFGDQSLDAVVMVNTLYAVNAPSVCLREVHRILRPNGRLLLTTPHSETNVNHLLTELRRSLSDQGLFEKYSDAFRVAEERHRALSEQIHRFSLEQTVSIVEDCGFEIESCAITYVNSVIILAARRR